MPVGERTDCFYESLDSAGSRIALPALIFEFFGSFTNEEIHQRYCNNQFVPCAFQNWQLGKKSYQVASEAVSWNRAERYRTFEEFFYEWKNGNL